MNHSTMEGAQYHFNEALRKLSPGQILEIWDNHRDIIISAFSDDDIAEIEKEHWANIVLQHKERISKRKTQEEE